MARVEERLAEAASALATLDELVVREDLSVAERDGAILRLVYTVEAIWKTAALLVEHAALLRRWLDALRRRAAVNC